MHETTLAVTVSVLADDLVPADTNGVRDVFARVG